MESIYFSRLVSQEIVQVQKYCGKRRYLLLNSCFWKASNNNNKISRCYEASWKGSRKHLRDATIFAKRVGCIAANFAKIFSREDQRARCERFKDAVPFGKSPRAIDVILSESVFRSCLCFIHVKQRCVSAKRKDRERFRKIKTLNIGVENSRE